jgi:hypothetical protein
MRSVRRSAVPWFVPVVVVLAGCGASASSVAEPAAGPVSVGRGAPVTTPVTSGPTPAVVPPSVKSIPDPAETVTREVVEGVLLERDGGMSFRPCPGSALEAERLDEWWLVPAATSGFWDGYRRAKVTTRASPAMTPDPYDSAVYLRAQAEVRRPGGDGPGGAVGGQLTVLSVSGMRLLTSMCTPPS